MFERVKWHGKSQRGTQAIQLPTVKKKCENTKSYLIKNLDHGNKTHNLYKLCTVTFP